MTDSTSPVPNRGKRAKDLNDSIRYTMWSVFHLRDRLDGPEREADREAVAAVPGLAVCGAAYDGLWIPACIATGRRAAREVLGGLTRPGTAAAGAALTDDRRMTV